MMLFVMSTIIYRLFEFF